MPPSIVIFGGGGFLGSRISQAALSKGWRVTSISRKGRPPPPPTTREEDWRDAVEWVEADAFDPSSYRSHLKRADHVAHTIGVLDYRGVGQERNGYKAIDKIGLTLRDAVSEVFPGSPSPRSGVEDRDALATYDRLNTEALVRTATEASKHESIRSFTYISTAGHFPGIPRRYVESKRRAESFLASMKCDRLRKVIMRPGFMYDDNAGATKIVARALGLSYALNSALGDKLSPLVGAAGVKPLSVARVGAAVVEAASDERVSGVVDIHTIEALADVRWRAEMVV